MLAAADSGRLVLRVTLGVLVLLHGIAKLIHGPAYIVGLVTGAGLPALLAYGVYVGEVVAPILVIIGLWARAGALVIAINMLVALALVHMGQLFALNAQGGWELELQGMFLFSAVAVALLGAGRFSVAGANGRWN
jgi:putative oxidoreductase